MLPSASSSIEIDVGLHPLAALQDPRTRGAGCLLGLLAASCGLVGAGPASAQPSGPGCEAPYLLRSGPGARDVRVSPTGRLCVRTPLVSAHRGPKGGDRPAPGPAPTFAASLVLPGAGQWLQDQRRTYLYLGVEVLAWTAFAQGRFEGADLRSRYRDLAWRIARGGEGEPGLEADFQYYEALAHYRRSGAWDRDPDRTGLQPETNPNTYNGRIWALARELYSLPDREPDLDSEAHARALEYYREHGYPPDMAWDWSRNPDAAERYRHFIEESDDAFRRATIVLAVIAANHVLSAVDGFLSARIASGRPGDPASADGGPPSSRTPWRLELRLGGHP